MAKFEIKKRTNGEFHFNLKAGNGHVILTSEGYTNKDNCKKGIESVRKNSQIEMRYHKLVSKNGKPYFNLTSTNGQIIGVSEMYESNASRDNGMASVMRNAPDAKVMDMTLETVKHQ